MSNIKLLSFSRTTLFSQLNRGSFESKHNYVMLFIFIINKDKQHKRVVFFIFTINKDKQHKVVVFWLFL